MPSPSSAGSTASPGTAAVTRAEIDEQLRLRIADRLGGGFKGDIIGPDHAGYGDARLVWNAMVDKRPGLPGRAQPAGMVGRSRIWPGQVTAVPSTRALWPWRVPPCCESVN
jgi:hypothetical protein